MNFPRSPERSSRFDAGVLALLQNLRTIHEDVFHPGYSGGAARGDPGSGDPSRIVDPGAVVGGPDPSARHGASSGTTAKTAGGTARFFVRDFPLSFTGHCLKTFLVAALISPAYPTAASGCNRNRLHRDALFHVIRMPNYS